MTKQSNCANISTWLDPWGHPGRVADAVLREAISALPKPLKLSETEVANQIQFVTWAWCIKLGAEKQRLESGVKEKNDRPSESVKKWQTLENALKGVLEKLEELHAVTSSFSDWSGAADELATDRHNIYPPHVDAERVTLPPVHGGGETSFFSYYDMDKAFLTNLASPRWLLEVTRRAKYRAQQDKKDHGSKEPDRRAYETVRNLATLFEKATGSQARGPGHTPDKGRRTGDFLNFIAPIIASIDGRSRIATGRLIERALSQQITVWDTRTKSPPP